MYMYYIYTYFFGISVSSKLFCEDFFETLFNLSAMQFYYQLNHQLLLLFFCFFLIALFEAIFIESIVDFLALSRGF